MAWAENIYFSSEGFVLDVPSFNFPDEGVTCVWGASGSGKSTLLQCLAGLVDQDKFKLSLGDDLVSELPLKERNVGFVFQDFALFPHMTVWENVAFAAEAKGLDSEIWREHGEKLVQRLSLNTILNQKAGSLSGGEQQRVALARALVTKPRLVLLDEPLSALDEKLRDEARFLIYELSQEFRVPFILVTHDIRDVRAISSHILVLSHGKSRGQGTTTKILSDPDDLELARLIPENQSLRVNLKGYRVFLADYDIGNVKEKPSKAGSGLIAKNWSFEIVGSEGDVGGFSGRLLEIMDAGPLRWCLVALSDGQLIKARSAEATEALKKGTTVSLRVHRENMILFRDIAEGI